MKLLKFLWAAALVGFCLTVAHSQPVPPIDHVVVRDPRIFNLSADGMGYSLSDGPVASLQLMLVHGPRGALVADVMVADNHLNNWGPVTLAGKAKVKSTLPLSIRLKGGGKGLPKVMVQGSYDASVKLMRVVVRVRTPEGINFQWNDAFVPDHADDVGLMLDRVSVATNSGGKIKGAHNLTVPGGAVLPLMTMDRELINSDFQLKGKGVNLIGDYNGATDSFSVYNARFNVGYGKIFTPGSLVEVSSDKLFLRN